MKKSRMLSLAHIAVALNLMAGCGSEGSPDAAADMGDGSATEGILVAGGVDSANQSDLAEAASKGRRPSSPPGKSPAPAPVPSTSPAPAPVPSTSPAPTPAPSTAPAPSGATDPSGETPLESGSGEPLVAVTESGLPLASSDYARLYGPGTIVMDSLANLVVGVEAGLARVVSQRFRAPSSDHVSTVKAYFISSGDRPGYSLGNGGKIRVSIYPDDGSAAHRPDLGKSPLAQGIHIPQLANGQPAGGFFPEVQLNSSLPLQSGTLYHILYENIDTNPAANYVSVNNSLTWSENGRPARWAHPHDLAVLLGMRPVGSSQGYDWDEYSTGTSDRSDPFEIPIFQVTLASGAIFGNSDMETGNVDYRHWRVKADRPIRERIKPAADRIVSGLSVMTAASQGGSLKWEIKEGSTVLVEGLINQSTPNFSSTSFWSAGGRFKWYDVALPRNVTLRAGGTYDLVFTPMGGSEWVFADERNGADYGFQWPASFNESQAQHLASGSWLDAHHENHSVSGTRSNWRYVLHLAP